MVDTRAGAGLPYFFFGTLMDADVLGVVLGRPPAAIAYATARLEGYRRWRVRGESYPIVRPDSSGGVDGVLVSDLSPAEIGRLNFYEGEEYRPLPLTVTSAGGPRRALVFADDGGLQTDGDWAFERWQREEKAALLAAARAFMADFGRIEGRSSMDARWRKAMGRASR
jgi:hypothetical protein